MMDEQDPEDADWRAQPDWPEHLAAAVGQALVATTVEPFEALLGEVDLLLSSGHEEEAAWVSRAALYRAVHGPAGHEFSADGLFKVDNIRAEIEAAAQNRGNDELRASSLGALGRTLTHQRDYKNALLAYRTAAEAWCALRKRSDAALQYLRAGGAALNLPDGAADAVEFSTRARTLFEEEGDAVAATWAILNLAQARVKLGDLESAHQLLTQGGAQGVALRDGHLTASVELEKALLAIDAQDPRSAHEGFLRAYRSAARRKDEEQAFVAAKNLAVLAGNQNEPRSSIRWWRTAVELADERRDWRDQQGCRYALGMELAAQELYAEAIPILDAAARINRERGATLDADRITADRGAVELDRAIKGDLPDGEFDQVVSRATRILLRAMTDLEEAGDYEWAEIAVRNLRTAWTLQKIEKRGASTLLRAAGKTHIASEGYAEELRRNAAWLMLSSGSSAEDDSRPAQWLIEAARNSASDSAGRASALAREAGVLSNRGFNETALTLYDAAFRELDRVGQASVYGNILNDSVLVLAELGRTEEAHSRLVEVESIARETNNRVLLSLALANLGETAIRRNDVVAARLYLREVVDLSTQTGDDDAVAGALAKLSNTYVNEVDGVETATALSAEAQKAAARAGTHEAWLHAQSAAASASFARDDYETAFQLWMECAQAEPAEDGAEHQAFALDALARQGNWPRYRRVLERMIRRAQAEGAQFAFVEKLHLSALSWLHQGRPAAAGKVLAYGVLLAIEAASKKAGRDGRILSTAEREREYLRIASPMGALKAVLLLMDLPVRSQSVARRAYERTVRSVAPDDADQLLAAVESWVLSEDEEDLRG